MSYAKVPLACQNHPVGIEEVNQLTDNFAYTLSVMEPEHGTSEIPPAASGHPWAVAGAHNNIKIARAVVDFNPVLIEKSPPNFSGNSYFLRSSYGNVRAQYVSTGRVKVYVNGLTDAWGVLSPGSSAIGTRRIVSQAVYPASGDEPLYLDLYLWTMTGVTPVLANFPWRLVVYGTT